MKQKIKKSLMAIVGLLLSTSAFAHDFEVDGIYYNITSSTAKTVSVTYKGSYRDSYLNEYTGTITIPSSVIYSGTTYSVISISNSAFYYCKGLTSVTIGNSVTYIGDNAFESCTGLTSITIPNSVTSIGSSAFEYCSGLTSITIPNSVTEIGSYAFNNTPWYNNQPDGVVYINNVLYKYKGTMPEGTSIDIKEGTIYISGSAFSGCVGLTSITIPNSVTSIGNGALNDCKNLAELIIEDGKETLSLGYNDYEYDYEYGPDCDIVSGIGEGLFYDCPLEKLYLGRNLSYDSSSNCGYSPFYNNTKLKEVTIGNFVTSIGDYALRGYSGLTSIIVNSGNSVYDSRDNCNAIIKTSTNSLIVGCKNTIIPNSVISIGSYAFYNCSGLTSVTIPNSVTEIGDNAFSGCTGLTSITIPNSVTSIGSSAFNYCKNLAELIIVDGNKTLSLGYNYYNYSSTGEGLFYDCPLEKLYLGRNLSYYTAQSRGYSPFYSKTKLKEVTIGNSVTEIGSYAFYCCTGLTSVTIPNSVTSINNNVFYECSNLSEMTIPNTVTKIGDKALWGCNKLISSEIIDKTQTTVSIALATPTKYQTGVANENEKIASESNNVYIKGLKPNTKYTYNTGLIINNIFCEINSCAFTTEDLTFNHSDIIEATSASLKAYYKGDVTVVEYGIKWESNDIEYNNLDSISVYNLDPDTTYTVYYFLNTEEGGEYSTSWSVRTKSLTWSNGEYTATSTKSARLSVETNCDAIDGTGFEWKRYDAPETLTPNKAPCPIVNGKLIGSLRGLNPDIYYNCRPYYTSSSGKTYYGNWFTIFTGDANVYFEPEVSTSDKNIVVDNSAIINGYALAGSDDILEQGFEYWKTTTSPATYSSSGVMIAKASGISMSATITNLEYNSTYKYRAFATTEKGTIYGKEVEFNTGNDPAGVEYIESNEIDAVEVARYDIHGCRLSKPSPGFNIVIYSDGSTRKEIVKE